MRTRLYPPTRVCPSRRPASARDACSPFPCLPHCPVVSPRGSGEGEKGCLSPPRSFNMPEPLRLCPAPPGDAWGGGGAEGSSGRRAHLCSAGRARRVTRAGEEVRERARLRALGEPRAPMHPAALAEPLCRLVTTAYTEHRASQPWLLACQLQVTRCTGGTTLGLSLFAPL